MPPRKYVKAGYPSKSVNLKHLEGEDLSAEAKRLTAEMLDWFNDGQFDRGTLGWLINQYRRDSLSPFASVASATRRGYANQLDRWAAHAGTQRLSGVDHATIMGWHSHFADGGRVSNGHHMITQLRQVISYGVVKEDPEAGRIDRILGKLRFPNAKPRRVAPTRQQVEAVIAHADPVLALGLQLQWDLALRITDVLSLCWSHIDGMRLIGQTSKTGEDFSYDLALTPALWERMSACERCEGPLVNISPNEYGRRFRKALSASGVGVHFQARDLRAAAITEAEELGVELNARRQFARHRSSSTTEIYSRGRLKGVDKAMRARHRLHRSNTGRS